VSPRKRVRLPESTSCARVETVRLARTTRALPRNARPRLIARLQARRRASTTSACPAVRSTTTVPASRVSRIAMLLRARASAASRTTSAPRPTRSATGTPARAGAVHLTTNARAACASRPMVNVRLTQRSSMSPHPVRTSGRAPRRRRARHCRSHWVSSVRLATSSAFSEGNSTSGRTRCPSLLPRSSMEVTRCFTRVPFQRFARWDPEHSRA